MPPEISFREFATTISGVIAETGVNSIKSLSAEVAQEIEQIYYNFFGELYGILSQGQTGTPSRFSSNMGDGGAWKPLSQAWSDRKISSGGREEFYFGLTAQLNAARRKAASRKKRQGKVRGTPRARKTFMKFLEEMAGSSRENTKKFFGDIKVDYAINAKGRKKPINIQQTDNVITELGRITAHNDLGKMISNYGNVTLTADVSLFPLLATAQAFSEWYVVDMMAKKNGVNRKQWMKINSRFGARGSTRPIRAIITPLISWYATTGVTQALRRFYT